MHTRRILFKTFFTSFHVSLTHLHGFFTFTPSSPLNKNTPFAFSTHTHSVLSLLSMASNDLKHRVTPDPNTVTTTNDKRSNTGEVKRDKRMGMAKRGLKSLAIALTLPLSLSIISAYIGSSTANDAVTSTKPFWFPPLWALHLTCPASTFLTGLAAWMVWADGGFHRNPMGLLLYLAQLLFTVLWDPLVFAAGATRLGLLVCLGMFVSEFGCMRVFRSVNPIASELIKPCLAWVAFLFIVNLKLLSV